MASVGDSVMYVPGEDHARDRCDDGGCAWVLGLYDEVKKEVREIEIGKLDNTFRYLRQQPHEVKLLRNVRPRVHWPATVLAVHGDAVDLSIMPNKTVTLVYKDVKEDPEGRKPGTYFAEKKPAAPADGESSSKDEE